MKKIFIVLFLTATFCYSQKKNKETANLECVLNYFKQKNEPQKLNAAEFLINNIQIHKSVYYKWFYQNGEEFKFSEYNFEDYKKAYKELFNLQDSIGLQPEKIISFDREHISCDFLIKNINNAFLKWKSNSWSKSYSFETFCEYILPYRSLIEPLEYWREDYESLAFRKKYNLEDASDPVELCSNIISNLKDFTFVNRRIDPNPLLSPKQMLYRKQGSCPDLANFALFINRAIGIAVSFDFTPHYGASSNRHFWNTIVDKNGYHIPFNSNSLSERNESLPYVYNASQKRLAKVFRKTYSIQKNSLSQILSEDKIPAEFLKQKNNLDVTSEYVKVKDLEINSSRFKDTIAYINVFNHGKWRIVDWTKTKNRKMVFKNLGRDIVYLPSYYNNEAIYLNYPFLIKSNGEVLELKPDFSSKYNANLSRKNEKKTDYIDFNTLEIVNDDYYNLFYWSSGWKLIGKSKAINGSVFFENIPKNALFLMLPKNKDNFERVFTIEPETKKIYWY